MKLVDILFLLSAAATANAILIPFKKDGLPHASSTSSQVSSTTNEPVAYTYNEYQEPMDISEPGTSSQDQQQAMDSDTFNEYQEQMDISDPGTSSQDKQQAMDSDTFNEYQEQMDTSDPGTYSQDQKQSMDKEPGNTGSNQAIVLSEQDQRALSDIKKKLKLSKEIQKKKLQAYSKYKTAGLKQRLALSRGENISGSRHNPEVEKQLEQEYVAAITRVTGIRQQLKSFMERYGLEFKEPNSN
ncbi:hypothetical protein O5D80_007743 [Batrachochytrium dendrobatidis]|nr:hypothetical protein O5D80_007743 [Batrachochytrium dendrobatidis]